MTPLEVAISRLKFAFAGSEVFSENAERLLAASRDFPDEYEWWRRWNASVPADNSKPRHASRYEERIARRLAGAR